MKKFVVILISVTVLGLTVYLFTKHKKAEEQVETVNEYPPINITNDEGYVLNLKKLKGNNILIFFQPDCDHCQREAREIKNHLESFSEYKLYFITTNDHSEITKFAEDYGLLDNESIKFGQTTVDQIINYLGPISAPSLYIYRAGKLVAHLDGEKPIEEIIKNL